ncbi:hypothetical protein Tco_0739770 [Tanacetum coccineum]
MKARLRFSLPFAFPMDNLMRGSSQAISVADAQIQDQNRLHDEIDDSEKTHDDSSLQNKGTADQQVNTARPEVNTGSREVSTAPFYVWGGFLSKSSLETISAIEMLWEWRGIANMDFIQLGGSSRVDEMILARERSGFAGKKYGATYKL